MDIPPSFFFFFIFFFFFFLFFLSFTLPFGVRYCWLDGVDIWGECDGARKDTERESREKENVCARGRGRGRESRITRRMIMPPFFGVCVCVCKRGAV